MMDGTGTMQHPNGRFGAYYNGIPLNTHETEGQAWADILANGPNAWRANEDRRERWIKRRADKPSPEIGQIIDGFLITASRFVRDGMLGSGHMEFYGISIDGMRGEHWFSEKILQDFS